MRQRMQLGLLVAMCMVVAPAAALAQGHPAEVGAGRGPGGFYGGILEQLLFACQAACGDTLRECVDAADADAVTCVTAACSSQISAAQTACASARGSQACRTAVSALRDCGSSCLTTRSTAVGTCRDGLNTCRDACTSGN